VTRLLKRICKKSVFTKRQNGRFEAPKRLLQTSFLLVPSISSLPVHGEQNIKVKSAYEIHDQR
jgi:hypothetical protein